MKIEEKNNFIDKLENIQSVDTPAYLYTRIQEKIKKDNFSKMPKWMIYVLSASLAIILIVNIFTVIITTKSDTQNKSLAEQMNLIPNNNLYHYE